MSKITASYDSSRVEVSYPMREAQQTITRAEYDMICTHPNKVMAIKFIRAQYGIGLFEAKQVVDTVLLCPGV